MHFCNINYTLLQKLKHKLQVLSYSASKQRKLLYLPYVPPINLGHMTLFISFMSFLLQQIIGNINDMTMSFEEDKDKIEQIHQLSNNGRDYLIYILEQEQLLI